MNPHANHSTRDAMRISAGTASRLRTIKKLVCKTSFVVVAVASMLSGCASNSGTPQPGPKNAVQSNTGPTVSGYVDFGAKKSFH